MANLIDNSSAFLEPLDYSNLTTAEKALVDALISAATTYIERYCNRIFASATYTDEVHDGNGWKSIFVKNIPIVSLTDVDIISTNFDTDTVTTTYAASKFDINYNTGELRFKPGSFISSGQGYFPVGFRNVQITYVGGFTSVPQLIRLLAAEFVLELFDPTLAHNLQKEKIGDYAYDRGKGFISSLTFAKRKLLDIYKIRRISMPVEA